MKNASYDRLLAGSLTFKSRVMEQDSERFESLAAGQSPKITFLTCSDSRIDPCALTDTKPGDLFVIRNAGNIVPPENGSPCGELASLEFAVKGLKTEHIVVCGHSDCGLKRIAGQGTGASSLHSAEMESRGADALEMDGGRPAG